MVYVVEQQKRNCNSENMLGALSLLANSGADFSNAGMEQGMNGNGLQDSNISSSKEIARSRALWPQHQLMGFSVCMLSIDVKS